MNHKAIVLAGCFVAFVSGCVVETAAVRGAYERCFAGDSCTSGTYCTQAMYSVSGAPGNLCSTNCSNGAQCPSSPYFSTYLPTCIVSVSTRQGLCYDTCLSDGDCGGGTRCAQIGGTSVRVCVPAT